MPSASPFVPQSLTAGEYYSDVQLLSTEIEDALVIHHTAEAINRLALDDKAIFKALNRDPLFWQTQAYCLQQSLFITLSRIFDTAREAKSIHSLLNATTANIQLFSDAALRGRKTQGGPDPGWLEDFMAQVWIPRSVADLRHLKLALRPHTQRWETIYRPIRNSIFAHRLMSNLEAGSALFGNTNRDHVTETLDFLHDLINTVTYLYMNGSEPVLGRRNFEEHNQRIRDGVSVALRRLC